MDKRIGKRSADKNTWPELTISGKEYKRSEQQSTISLGFGHFAVKDAYPSRNENELILELEAIVKEQNAPKSAKSATVKEGNNG